MTIDFNDLVNDSTPQQADARTRVKKWKRLTWWGWVFGGLFFLPAVVLPPLHYFIRDLTLDRVSMGSAELAGGLVFVLLAYLFSVLIGWIRRSRTAVSVTFIVLGLLTLGGQLGDLEQRGRESRQFREAMDELTHDLDSRARERFEQDNFDVDVEGVEMVKRRITEATGDGTREQRITGEVATAFMDRIQEAALAHGEAVDQLMARSPLGPSWINSPEDLEDARRRTLAFRECNEVLALVINTDVAEFQREFERRGISDPSYAREFVRGMRSRADYQPLLELRETDRRLADLLLDACDLLESHWSDWQYDLDHDSVVFSKDEPLHRWNQIIMEVQAVADRQSALQRAAVGLPPEVSTTDPDLETESETDAGSDEPAPADVDG